MTNHPPPRKNLNVTDIELIRSNSPRHPECSEGSACSGTIFKVAMDTNRSIQ
ncbi:hypothetical protein Loak_0911, partial [Legionella oakridgensis]